MVGDDLPEPLPPATVKKLLAAVLDDGRTSFSRHALEEMATDRMSALDVENVLLGGVVEPGEFVKGTWRYRVRTGRMMVVVSFRSSDEVVVVTAWRKKQ